MRRLVLSGIAMLAATVAVHAADLGVAPLYKKGLASPFLTTNGSGFYWGIGTSMGVDQANVSGNNLFATSLVNSSLNATGASVDLEGGYIWGNASAAGIGNWYRVYASGSYQNISAGTASGGGAAFASRWSAQEGVDVNADVIQIALSAIKLQNPFPSFTPQLPSNIAVAASPRQYVGVFLNEFGVNGTVGVANGVEVGIAPGIRTGFLYQTVDANGKPNGNAVDLGVSVAWPTKGFTLNNVFSANGTPLTTNPGVSLGTQYKAYIRYDF